MAKNHHITHAEQNALEPLKTPSHIDVGEIAIYNPDDSICLEVRLDRETVWLSQSQMGRLFGVDRTVIVKHIGNIYKSGELEEAATCAKNAQVQIEGSRTVERAQNYYNLDMILSVGYRVNSRNATYFRKWASCILKDYLIRGKVRSIGRGVPGLPSGTQTVDSVRFCDDGI